MYPFHLTVAEYEMKGNHNNFQAQSQSYTSQM